MKFLAELLTDYRRLDPSSADGEGQLEPSEEDTGEFDLDSDKDIDDTLPDLDSEDFDTEDNPELDDIANQATEDPNRAGLIRTVKGAHLVYKRKTEDGTYEELWMYNISSIRNGFEVRKAILAGTDIPVSKTRSPDGDQTYTIWSMGNAELMNIEGLPN